MIATCSYRAFEPSMGLAVSISLGRPHWPLPYRIAAEVSELKPWGLLDAPDWAERYLARLDEIGPDRISRRLESLCAQTASVPTVGNIADVGRERLVLLCFEKSPAGCHRSLAARWLSENLGIDVPELEPAPDPQLHMNV
jgi:hypothetical protein